MVCACSPDLILLNISEWFNIIVAKNLQKVKMTMWKICSGDMEFELYPSLLFIVGACSTWFGFAKYLGMIRHYCCWKLTARKYDTVKDLQLWWRVWIVSEPCVYGWRVLTWFGFVKYPGMIHHDCCWQRVQLVSVALWKICSFGVEFALYWTLLFKVDACSPDLVLLNISEWFTINVAENLQKVSMRLWKICSCGVEFWIVSDPFVYGWRLLTFFCSCYLETALFWCCFITHPVWVQWNVQ